MLYIDTETLGLTGPVVIIQTGKRNQYGELEYIDIWRPWEVPVKDTLQFIESLFTHETFNLFNSTYDSFHLCKLYNTFSMVDNKNELPDKEEIFGLEQVAWMGNYCLKPNSVKDTYILLRRNLFQFLMVSKKNQMAIRKVHISAVKHLKPILEEWSHKELHPLLFEKFRDKREHWKVFPTHDPEWMDIKLSFFPAMGLKPFAKHVLNKKVGGIEIEKEYWPTDEVEYRPYNLTWPKYLDYHQAYWHTTQGVEYAKNDIQYLHDFKGYLDEQKQWTDDFDIDSDLAWMVGQVRLSGFRLDNKKLKQTILDAESMQKMIPTAPNQVMNYLRAAPDWKPEYELFIQDTKEKSLVEASTGGYGAVSQRAQQVIDQRHLDKKLDLLKKLELIGRAHPDFSVSGTKTNRMAGRGGINYQGINKKDNIRDLFIMHETRKTLPKLDKDYVLSGGDFKNQEVTILDAVVNDPQLHKDLVEHGSLHVLTWRILWKDPEAQLADIKKQEEKYGRTKNGVFAKFYGALEDKLAETFQVSIEYAREFIKAWNERYPKFGEDEEKLRQEFCSMVQEGGLGGRVVWKEPKKYAETMFGYRRWFVLENKICRFLFELAERLPFTIDTKVRRRDREQTVTGALRSALYAAAFGMQAANLRQAGNHRIQGTGAEVTKRLQWNVWTLQPIGVEPFKVKPFNIHDELMVENNCPEAVAEMVSTTVSNLKQFIPLLEIDWDKELPNWKGN